MDELFSVRDRTVVITGGASGLGLQLARLFIGCGAKVCSADLRHDDAVRTELQGLAGAHEPVFIDADLSGEAGITAAFETCAARCGPVQVLFNNAGRSLRGRFLDVAPDDWDRLSGTSLKGLFFVAQAAARQMRDAGAGGSIINMSSILGARAMTGTSAYAAIKAGVAHLTRSMALELGPMGIRVNAIAPGWFDTPMTAAFLNEPAKGYLKGVNPLRRLGQPGDLDGVALLLASDAGSYINGAVITVDGGQSL